MEIFNDITKDLLSLSRGDVSMFSDATKVFTDRMTPAPWHPNSSAAILSAANSASTVPLQPR